MSKLHDVSPNRRSAKVASPAKLVLAPIPEGALDEVKAEVKPVAQAPKSLPKPAPKPKLIQPKRSVQLPPSARGQVELIVDAELASDSEPGGQEALTSAARTEASRVSDAMLGAGFVCPTYLSDQFGSDGAWTNMDYNPEGWTKKCLRGKAYSASGNKPSTNVKEAMLLIRELRLLANGMRWSKLKEEERYSLITLSKLNSARADDILRRMWDYEFNSCSIRQIYLALLPIAQHVHDEDLDKMNKHAMIDSLVRAHVPFVFFDWMQQLADALRVNAFEQITSCSDARLHFLGVFVFCDEAEFLAMEAAILSDDCDPEPEPQVMPKVSVAPVVPKLKARASPAVAVAKASSTESKKGGASASEDSEEPGSSRHRSSSRKVFPDRTSKRRKSLSPSGSSTSSFSCGSTPSPSRSPDSRRKSKKSKHGRSRSARRSRGRKSPSKGRSRSSKKGTASRSRGPTKARKSRSVSPRERSSSPSSSSDSSRSRSRRARRSRSRRSRSAEGIQSGLAKVLKGFLKAQKPEPKTAKSRIAKHLDRLDEGLRAGTYIDPCAYSAQHLISVEMKGSSAKDSLAVHNGRLVTDENAAEDVTGAPSSISALKEGLHFIAQRLMTIAEFKSDTARVADRYKFIAYIEADFAGAQPDKKVPVLKEFIRRVSMHRLWCPEIPIQSALFFQAFTAPAQKVVHVDENGEQIHKTNKNRNRERNRGGERGRGRGRGRGGGGGGGGGGGDKANKNTFTQEERKKCGPCPSRTTKDGVCPSDAAATPWTCKFDHNCPRCPSKSHRAKFCKLCLV